MAIRRERATLPEHTFESVVGEFLRRVLVIAPPLAGFVLVPLAGLLLHHVWPGVMGAFAVTAGAAVLTAMDVHLTRHRDTITGRLLAPVTTALIGMWLAWVTWFGYAIGWHPLTLDLATRIWVFEGGTLTLVWVHWLHIHEGGDDAGASAGAFTRRFSKAMKRLGYPAVRLVKLKGDPNGKRTAQLLHAPGMTHDDAPTVLAQASSMLRLPHGMILPRRNEDDDGATDLVIADPRVLSKRADWPGASRVGKSVADPLRVGMWQDRTTVELILCLYHLQIMAMTGAGKTRGAAYSILRELITRKDVFVVAADLGKGAHYLGQLADALWYLATTPDEFYWLVHAAEATCLPRSEFLGSRRLGEWRKGCGLMYGVLWIEEASDAFEAIDSDLEVMFRLLRKMRSAGWSVVYSLQRASHDQMPTFLRDMVALLTMGVKSASHAKFGLSDPQAAADLDDTVAMWGDHPEHQGKFVLDAPTVDAEHRVMPGRFYYHGDTLHPVAADAAKYPAHLRPPDEITLPLLTPAAATGRENARQQQPEKEKIVTAQAAAEAARFPGRDLDGAQPGPGATPSPYSPGLTATLGREADKIMDGFPGGDEDTAAFPGSDEPLDVDQIDRDEGNLVIGVPTGPVGPDTPVSPELALQTVREQIQAWRRDGGVPRHGGRSMRFRGADLAPLASKIGKTRSWAYWILPKLADEHEIASDGGEWRILPKAA